jgi:3-hydroxyacyl-CoA dehydrogenase/enamine deaminase RidA (YjgF/YER057c/UK114 family)
MTRRVAIVGAGLIGGSWAHVFARAGWEVRIWDPAPEQRATALGRIRDSLHELAHHGLVEDPHSAAALLHFASTLEDALEGAEHVQESGPETLEAKQEIFARLDACTSPDAVIASSTSAIVASAFTETLPGRERCIVAHPVNPPHLVPIVELCGAPWTSLHTRARAREVFESVGQVPVEVRREIDGFILNRLQAALLGEAFRLVQEGYVSPEDLDHTVADGLGLRWAFMGPFETIELNAPEGIPDYCQRYTPWFRRYAASHPPPSVWDEPKWREVVEQWPERLSSEAIAKKTLWRNERLAALRAHKQSRDSAEKPLQRGGGGQAWTAGSPPARPSARISSEARGTDPQILYTNPPGAGPAQGLYSNVTTVPSGSTVYIAGQLAVASDGSVAGRNDFEVQMRQVFANLGAVLYGLGLTFNHVVKFTTYLVHAQDIEKFMRIRAALFPQLFQGRQYPPNTLLVVDRLVKEDFLVEVEAVATGEVGAAMRQDGG